MQRRLSRETYFSKQSEIKKCFSVLVARNEPQANKKFFDPTIFQKCWRGVGEQPTFAEQITELHNGNKTKI
jgi:hypothetical protein